MMLRHCSIVAGRHDVDAGNVRHVRQFAHHVDADATAFRRRIARALQAINQRVGNDGTEQFLLDPARRLGRAQRHDADQDRQFVGHAVLGEPRHVAAHHAGIHAELRLHELRAGRRSWLAIRPGASRAADRSDCRRCRGRKSARPVTLRPRRQFAGVAQPPRGLEQRARIEIEYRLGVRLVAGARIVTAQHQQIAHARGRRAQQIALQARCDCGRGR